MMRGVNSKPSINVYGISGYGKSHILAALACLLIRQNHRVVYIPDCRQAANKPFSEFKRAFMLAFADPKSSKWLQDVFQCDKIEQLQVLSRKYRFVMDDQITFILDQTNALDLEVDGRNNISIM
jgi:energy-coupling factor transporter ATP-binding protein EcfA2